MIIWIASYPKSGNTWVRLFLDYLFSPTNKFSINKNYIGQFPLREHFVGLTKNVDNQNEYARNCKKAQLKLNSDSKIKIFKTHNALWSWNNGQYSFTDEKCCLGVIHIVRDPRNIVTSILNYFHKDNYDQALEFMKENKVLGGGKDESGLPTIIGSWSNHYKSWKKFKKNNLLIRYEDLLEKPENEFFKITNFLKLVGKFKFKDDKIFEAIQNCKFNNLSKQEDLYGFDGNSYNNKKLNHKFFNLGPKNKWENLLNPKIKSEIELLFKEEMQELNYL